MTRLNEAIEAPLRKRFPDADPLDIQWARHDILGYLQVACEHDERCAKDLLLAVFLNLRLVEDNVVEVKLLPPLEVPA